MSDGGLSPIDRCAVSNIGVSKASRLIFSVVAALAFLVLIFISRPQLSRSSNQLFAASCLCPTFHEQVTGLLF